MVTPGFQCVQIVKTGYPNLVHQVAAVNPIRRHFSRFPRRIADCFTLIFDELVIPHAWSMHNHWSRRADLRPAQTLEQALNIARYFQSLVRCLTAALYFILTDDYLRCRKTCGVCANIRSISRKCKHSITRRFSVTRSRIQRTVI